ncbi:MAG TPA: outer membrane beta-barrel protein, partial [Chitinophagaceae bacterium]|nr:outer membrane beta-barrel protein [Chitinophagaceae bacterium]
MRIYKFQLVFLFLSCAACNKCFAQPEQGFKKITINGSLKDSNNNPYQFISIILLKAKDSTFIKGTLSDVQGNFTLTSNVRQEDYLIFISEINNKAKFKIFSFAGIKSDSVLNAGLIVIPGQIKNLEEVTVNGKAPLLTRKLDRLEVNIANSVLSTGYNATEVLSKIPGVYVDPAGEISVNGKGNIYIMIDGKGEYMNKAQAEAVLTGMRSENIEKIQVITNPSAKYEAQGSAIIDIITKKDKMKSDMHATYGNQLYPAPGVSGFHYPMVSTGINLNYSFDKLKTFGSFDFINTEEFRNYTKTNLIIPGNNIQRNDTTIETYKETGLNYRLGFNYDFNKHKNLDVVFNSFGSPRKRYSSGTTNYYSPSLVPESVDSIYTLKGSQVYDKSRFNSFTAKFTNKIGETDKRIYFLVDYSGYSNPGDQLSEGLFNYGQNLQTKSDNFSFLRHYKVNIYSAHIDYEQPFKKNAFLEAGLKMTKIQNNDNSIFEYSSQQGTNLLAVYSNKQFKYDELVSGGYLNLRKSYKKLSMQAGMRGEYTNSKGIVIDSLSEIKRNYFN